MSTTLAAPPVNPIVMSMTDTSVPSRPDALGEAQPNPTSAVPNERHAPPPGFGGLEQPFRAANVQMPPRQRMPLFQHSHPPLSLFDPPDPLSSFGVFGMGGGPFGPLPFGGGPINLGGPMGMPFGGPMGAFPPRMPTFIIIETADDDDEDSQLPDPLFMPGARGGRLPSSASSLGQDPRRDAEVAGGAPGTIVTEEPLAPRALRIMVAKSRYKTLSRKARRNQRKIKNRNNNQRRLRRELLHRRKAVAEPAVPPKPADKKDVDEDSTAAPAAEKTVMRLDHIETLTTAGAAFQKVGMFGRHISASSGKKCIVPDPLVIRCSKSRWDTPFESKHEQNEVIRDLPSPSSTCESASVSSNSSTTLNETMTAATTTTTESADVCPVTTPQVQTSGDDSDVNYLRPVASQQDVTALDNAQDRDINS
ncbi:hypothetical protein MTO96_022353 [Rhipicephalus appendiculatus]